MAKQPKSQPGYLFPQEVAAALGVEDNTVHAWRFRGKMPEPAGILQNTFPFWAKKDIIIWASKTGRLRADSSLWSAARRMSPEELRAG
jgi:hypothetical protein